MEVRRREHTSSHVHSHHTRAGFAVTHHTVSDVAARRPRGHRPKVPRSRLTMQQIRNYEARIANHKPNDYITKHTTQAITHAGYTLDKRSDINYVDKQCTIQH